MCNYSDFVEQQGIVKGRAEGRAEGYVESLSASVANLVRSGTLTLDTTVCRLAATTISCLGAGKEMNSKPSICMSVTRS